MNYSLWSSILVQIYFLVAFIDAQYILEKH